MMTGLILVGFGYLPWQKKPYISTKVMRMKKYLLLGAGGVSLSLGIVGIFVPVLPTTPFLLLSAYCFLRSSSRLYHWLTRHKLFGAYIRNYIRYKAITRRAKIISLVFLWAVILSTVFLFIDPVWLDILLVVIAAGVTVHILSLRTLTKEMIAQGQDEPDKP